ncbi:MAG TPA: serine hydrolase domain-containing protein, partial [Phytomonospora sp.]
MTDALASLVDEKLTGVPGAAVAVRQGPATQYRSCLGFADLEWRRPVTPATVFRLASLSKPFTALTVRLLAADGVLDLDAPIARHLPGLPHGDRITPRHLLTHTSGIPNFVARPGFRGETSRRDHTDDEVVALFAGLPLDFAPGTRYGYSNSGYRLLDIIASRATGTPFAELAAAYVFAPAGMAATRVLCDRDIVPERARGYERDGDAFVNAPYVSMT